MEVWRESGTGEYKIATIQNGANGEQAKLGNVTLHKKDCIDTD